MKQLVNPQRLSQLVMLYLKKHKPISASTAELTRRAFAYLQDCIGDAALGEIGFSDAEDYQAALIDRGLSKTSANIFIKSVGPVFNWAVQRRILESNPFKGLKRFRVSPKRVEVFRPDEIERLLAASDDLWRARILLGLTSLRKGEVLNLTGKDVDFERQLIFIQSKADTAYAWPWEPKDHDRRMLPLIPALAQLLRKILAVLPDGQPYLMIKKDRYGHLIRHKDSMTERMRKEPDNNFSRGFRNLCKRAFVNGNFHMLRKTGLTELTSGMRVQEVKEIAGHSSIETTLRYLAVRSDSLTRASDIISRGVAQFG